MHTYGMKVNSGEIKDDEMLFVWWGCPPERYNLATDAGVRAAIRDASPAADLFLNVGNVAAKYHQIDELEFHRYDLSTWTVAMDSWLPAGAWDGCADTGKSIPDGARICLGFDGSFSRNSTALIAVTCEEVPHVDVVACWERPSSAWQGWKVPTMEVEETIREACSRFDVAELAVDMYGWRHVFEVLEDDGLPVVDFPQLRAHMVGATERAYDMIRNQQLTHSGDPRLTRHVANARAKNNASGSDALQGRPQLTQQDRSVGCDGDGRRPRSLTAAAIQRFGFNLVDDRSPTMSRRPTPNRDTHRDETRPIPEPPAGLGADGLAASNWVWSPQHT
jgi:phage terminase large subunit-like protein